MQAIPSLTSFVWKTFRRYTVANTSILFFSLAWTLDQTAWPYVFKLLIDAITQYEGDRQHLFQHMQPYVLLVFGLWLTIELSFRCVGLLISKYHPKMDADTHRELFSYVLKHSHRYFSDRLVGTIADKIGGQMAGAVVSIISLISWAFIPASLAIIISVSVMATLHPFFALVLGGWCVLQVCIGVIGGKGISKRSASHSEALSQVHGATVDSMSGYTTVSLFARRSHEESYVDALRQLWQRKYQRTLLYQEGVRLVMGLVGGGAWLGLIWLSLYSWQQGIITTGDVVYVFTTTWNIMNIVWHVSSQQMPEMYKQIGICKQAMQMILVPHDIVDVADAKTLKVTRGEIVFDKVNFHYVPEYNIFNDKSLMIRGGERVGLVGYSGSGKSTFIHLILRFYDVESGEIRIDGQNIATVTQDSLRGQIAMIPQDTALFHRSLMENIRYGRLDATDEEVIEAAKHAYCHDFIMQLPEGYAALVGERGVKLSGGQRQRIAIARAMLKNAPILLLDEATSALDSVSEKVIKGGLELLMKERTTIVIAHRLSTLIGLDRILVFDEGHIIEDGTHLELLAAGGHYAKLWNMQSAGFLPDANPDD